MKVFAICMIGFMTMFVCVACAKDTPTKSPIDGMSDDVYEQIVQHYFRVKTEYEILNGEIESQAAKDPDWMKSHELYDDVEKYAKENELHPQNVFPNPIHIEYKENPEQFSETEQKYIEKLLAYWEAFNHLDFDEYERLQAALKEELEIKDSYNMFDVGE